MADRYAASTPATSGAITTTTETVVATSPGISTGRGGLVVTIAGQLSLTLGTGTTAAVLRCRRGTAATGAQVGDTVTLGATAGANTPYEAVWTDAPGDVAGQQYVLTVQQTGATGNGTVLHATIETHVDV